MHSDVDTLFRALWEDYRAVTPSADRIHGLLAERENTAIVNDHIALRTFNLAPVATSPAKHQSMQFFEK